MPNNRQLALLMGFTVLLVAVSFKADIRRRLFTLARSLVHPKLLLPMLLIFSYLGLLVVGSYQAGWWDSTLATDTAFWAVASGVVLFFNAGEGIKKPGFFGRTVRKLVGWTVAVEFLVGLTTGPLWFELVLSLLLAPIVMLHEWAKVRDGDKRIAGCLEWALALVGTTMLFVSVLSLLRNFDILDKTDLIQQMMLPVWMTIGSLPVVFLFGVYMHYETVWIRIRYFSDSSGWFRIWLAVFREYGFRTSSFDDVLLHIPRIARARSYAEARKVIGQVREKLAQERLRREAAEARLEEFAGVEGSDDRGHRLDRREFSETCAALSWLHNCHMGWWRREERYKAGLLELIGGPEERHNLSIENGYTEVVAPGGSAWFAWKRTVSNWVFAIGAANPPPDQWLYDGPEPPQGPPGVDEVWGHSPFSDDHSPNWVWGDYG